MNKEWKEEQKEERKEEQNKERKEAQDYILDKTLSRIDSLMGAINTKASFIIGFNTFILGAIVLKHKEVLQSFTHQKIVQIVPFILLLILAGVGISCVFVFLAVDPFRKSGKEKSKESSLLYFGSIAEMESDIFEERINEIDSEKLKTDLIIQIHTLAGGLSDKFKNISLSMRCLMYVVLLPLVVLAFLKVFEWFLI